MAISFEENLLLELWDAGAEAYRSGIPCSDCPDWLSDEHADYWQDGWIATHVDAMVDYGE